MKNDLDRLRDLLAEVEACLPLSNPAGHTECDDWCKLWMLLVGVHHSLVQAQDYVSTQPLESELWQAHKYAVTMLSARKAAVEQGRATWLAGYFLISAEHRLADALDRLTGLSAGLPGRTEVHFRRQLLARRCPECCRHRFSDQCRRVLTSEDGALLRVHQRVNVLKHHAKETKINKVPTKVRFSDATKALEDATILIREFATHAKECTIRATSPPNTRLHPTAAARHAREFARPKAGRRG